ERAVTLERHPLCKLIFTPRPSRGAYEMSYQGTVINTGASLDTMSGTLPVFVSAGNQDGRLKPGMQVTAFIGYTTAESVLSVPDSAITLLNGKPVVFIAKGKSFEPVNITVGQKGMKRTEVISGLKPGDRVVIKGAYSLKSALSIDDVADGH
ncbi:efflux RND transporter periplasmic adaptor subunit, partial [Enterobacter mori]|uniref:efflux RND transporter periplasmic adaptor subunit n=1 Tax=Enterobacter mori TaxID=539813 RepID=UPI003B8442A1